MQHYYHAFSQNADEANRKRECIEKEILPFQQYIDTAIKSLEKKKVRAKWERVETEFNATLEINGYFYEYKPLSQIRLKSELYTHLDSILFLEDLPRQRDYDEKLFITLENGEKIKISLKDGDIAQDYRVLDRLCNLANTGFEVQDNGNLESKDCHIERSEISSIESKKDCLAMSQNDKMQNLYSSNTGFIHLDSLSLDNDTKQKLKDSNIKKVSWSGDIKTLKQWLNNGKLDLDSKQVEIKSLQDNVILLKSDINKANIIQKDGYLLPATLEINYIQDSHKVLQDNKTHKIIYCKNEIKSQLCNPIEKHLAKSYCDFQSLCDKSGNKIDIEKQDSKQVFIKDIKKLDDKTILYDKFGISYTLKKIKNEGFNIRLLRDDGEREDENEIESPLRFFLDSDIQVMAYLDRHKKPQECRVKIINRDKFIIELLYKNRAILPRHPILETKPNPYPLKCQRNAIQNLIKMPLAQSHTLLKLFASRTKDKISWLTKDSKIIDITEWEVLTDENREGANIQRNFIQQALNTKDFALLEGPPGSGKTTTISELIAQIIKQNKRVLLCGSTHVAIDNVLERLKEKRLIEKLNIFPIRVGSEGALSEEVREFRLGDFARNYEDSLLEKYSVYNDLEKDSDDENKQGKIGLKFFMQCANLVCGTTIGILRYPAFKIQDEEEDSKKRNKKTIKPIMPDFDYLIIDESSKTTFQEFLVPAMYAKKWIIVGDTRQLSPFVDRDELADNIRYLALRYNKINKGFDFLESSYQQACFLLYLLSKIYKENGFNIKIAMGVSSEILWILEQEIEIRTDEKRDNFGVLNDKLKVGYIKDLQTSSYFDNLSKHWIFYDEGLAKKDSLHNPLKHLIPSDFIDFDNLSLLYQYKVGHKNAQLKFNNKKGLESFLKAIKDYKQERSFASEIAWRLMREFELRTFSDSNKAKNKNQSYTKAIDELLPKSHKDRKLIRNKISSIANIALPSILESLIKGVSDRQSEREDLAIRSGFTQEELKQRHSILSTQGRMHKDISRFPREQFYKEVNALKDLSNLEREWSYTKYKKRSVWINVDGKSYRGRNEKEAEILIQELKVFIDFASNNPHPLNETWSVAVLSFYKGQTKILESKLQDYTGLKHKSTDFTREWNGTKIQMKLCSVDRFQGQEADIVFLSMVNTDKIGFLDNPNRLNVGITRAKFQLVILGKYEYFSKCKDDMLKQFALHHKDSLHKGAK
ncbi:AAA ATPase [Helicobacter cinaedi]|uniref:AAA ATPase n=1 Tax=Helicobacter cinaedi TaxID=213 RepID=A0A377JTC3_9HELI|nr:AAA domain-containing protein [Helicobacter cinaedi]STP11229.1 AAA ATPase [Helicobacter cinaedi]